MKRYLKIAAGAVLGFICGWILGLVVQYAGST